MGVSSGKSQVAGLSLTVLGRVVHPEWFNVRSTRRVTRNGWEADVRLIEGGHAISWSSGPARITEILCDSVAPLPVLGVLLRCPIRRERSARLQPHPGVEYHTCFDVERLDRQVFARMTEELMLDPSRGDLFYQFSTPSRMAPPAVGRVHVEARARGLSVQGYHTFPGESAIVRTQSLFEILA